MKLYRESNQTIAETARNLGLKESTLANWVKKVPVICPELSGQRICG